MKIYAALLALLVLVAADDDCKCDEDAALKEIKELWDFIAPIEVGQDIFHTVPGELSPLAQSCNNCIEKNRKKREQREELKREERSPQAFRVWRHASDSRNKCPIGYIRLAIMCVKAR